MFRSMILFTAVALGIAPAHASDRLPVVGYIAAFKGLDREMKQQGLEQYSHLVLAFVNPTPSGGIMAADALACAPAGNGMMVSDAQLQSLVASSHRRGTKVLVSLGGAVIPPCGGDWAQLLSGEMRRKVETSIVELVDRYDLDGIDIDLEGDLMMRIDRAGNYTPFVRELASALHARAKLLTGATGSYPDGMLPDASLPYFDLIGVMSYDQVGPTWGPPGGENSTYEQAVSDLALWIRKGIQPKRLLLGIPFYGRGFGSFRPDWSLAEIAGQFGSDQLDRDVVGQRCGGCSYITYNGLATLQRKAQLARAWGVGVMVWEIGQDLSKGRASYEVAHPHGEASRYGRR